MIEETKDWELKQEGFIDYIFPRKQQFNVDKTKIAIVFFNDIKQVQSRTQ